MNTLLPHHRKSAGFAPYGCMELALLAYIVMAILNYVLGNWIVATSMLATLAALLIVTQFIVWRDRRKIGDQIRVSLGPHSGKEGVIIGENETGTRFTVQLSSAEHPDPIDFSDYQIVKAKPMMPEQR
jgi:hypothetical protein